MVGDASQFPPGPKLELLETTDESIILVFDVVKGVIKYELQYKKQGADWDFSEDTPEDHRSMKRNVYGGAHSRAKATLTKLDPATSYTMRLCCASNDIGVGEPGAELNVDTDPPSCFKALFGGKNKKKATKEDKKGAKKKEQKSSVSVVFGDESEV